MEKEMLVVAKFKEGEGKFEKFMGFMQSPEGLAERAKVAVPRDKFSQRQAWRKNCR